MINRLRNIYIYIYCRDKENNGRIRGLDFVKGICIIYVMLVHCAIFKTSIVGRFINVYGFFAVAGFMLNRNSSTLTLATVISKLRKRFKSLIIPYISFSMLAIVWHIILCVGLGCTEVSENYFGWTLILRDIFCMGSGLGIGTLWFLPVLFVTYALVLITLLLAGSGKRKYPVLVSLTVIAAFLAVFLKDFHPEAYFSGMLAKVISEYTLTAYRIARGYAFMLYGYLLHTVCTADKKVKWAAAVGLIAMLPWMEVQNYGACGILLIGSVYLLETYKVPAALHCPVLFLEYCGKHSLDLTIYHYIFLFPLEVMLLKAIGFSGFGWPLFAVNLASSLVAVYFCSKSRVVNFMLTGKRAAHNKHRGLNASN